MQIAAVDMIVGCHGDTGVEPDGKLIPVIELGLTLSRITDFCLFGPQNKTVNCWTTIHRHNKAVYVYVGWDMLGKNLVSSELQNYCS